ncbi:MULTISPECIES: hypothetical protein [Nonomuraea]|uniref:PE domain-containing protein n=1 Tax=Nonomuraea composti TaxID=2720023 RepID=A0ABX1BQW3_9ACTN|nr:MULTISPECIES: hypothetical protein [unclassified Nonomuraea]NJP98239.1 hypothetical protein [Nonomuraea sp. FMUSA5-5]
MGNDRGVELSRRAIKAARTDLEEALALLSPDSKNGGAKNDGTAQPVFAQASPALQLRDDYEAMSGYWPAATGFQTSAQRAIGAVTVSYGNIATQVRNVIDLLDQALRNYDDIEVDSEGRSQSVQV